MWGNLQPQTSTTIARALKFAITAESREKWRLGECNNMIQPFQLWVDWVSNFDGRCPSLTYAAPSGLILVLVSLMGGTGM